MDLPQTQTRNLAVWFRCQLCRGSFPTVTEFIEHKQQWHLTEFQKVNSNCILFEEITAAKQECADENQASTAINSRSVTELHGGPEPENVIVANYDPPPPQKGLTDAVFTAIEVTEVLELFTHDNETGREDSSGSRVTRSQSNGSKPGVSINEHHHDPDDPVYELNSLLNQAATEQQQPQQLERSNNVDISAAAYCVALHAGNDIGADIEPSSEPLNEIQQQLDLNLCNQIKPITKQMTETEEIHVQTCPQVKTPYVLMTRLTLDEIRAASQTSRPSKGQSLKSNRPFLLRIKRKRAASKGSSKPKSFKCSKAGCSKILSTLRSRTIHLTTHAKSKTNSSPILVCELCSRTFRFEKSFAQHYSKMHNQNSRLFHPSLSVSNTEVQSTLSETQKTDCSKLQHTMNRVSYSRDSFNVGSPKVQIKRLTSDQAEAATNFESKISKKRRNASTQKATFPFKLNRNSDFNTTQNSLLNSDLKPFKCAQPGCAKLFKTQDYLTRHSAIHKEGRPTYPCGICRLRFCSKFSLSRHSFLVHKHIQARPFKCSFLRCLKTFQTEAALKRHTAATHDINSDVDQRNRPVFTCEICKITFFYKFSLKRHKVASHQDDGADKPFKCTVKDCMARFNCKSSLILHKKRHNWN